MKHILILILFTSVSLLSFSQKKDTVNLFGPSKKKVIKDQAKELESHPASKLDSVYYIKYGTKTAQCSYESTVDSIHIVRTADKSCPVKSGEQSITADKWNMLISSIEINSFFGIPEKVGNPGAEAEWIEINYMDKLHKVTYDSTGPDEYEGIKNLSKLLKRITEF